MATLTFDYRESTAVLGPLAPVAEPGAYDLCLDHARSTKAPRGWELITLAEISPKPPTPGVDDLLALANAVREIGLADPSEQRDRADLAAESNVVELGRRGHLRMIADAGR